MKRIILTTMLMALMCFVLWGCGKSEAVKNVEALIDSIGEVTVDSEESIQKAEEADNALTDKEKEQVENKDQMVSKKEELESCIAKAEEEKKQKEEERKKEERKAKLAPFIGTWVPLYKDVFKASFDLAWSNDLWSINLAITEDNGNVTPGEDTITYVSSDEGISTFKLIDDQGIEKLVSPTGAGVYVRKEEYEAAKDQMFVHVILDEDNVGDYIGGVTVIGKFIDEWGDETNSDAYSFTSKAYEDEDLIMLKYKDVKYEVFLKGEKDAMTSFEPYPIMWGYGNPQLDHFGRAEGEIWYVKKEFVSDISKYENEGIIGRVITFTDGFVGDCDAPDTSNVNITVEDLEF